MKDNTIKKLVFAALFAALSCAATMVIRIPTPIGGYIHAGDAVVLLSAFLLGPWWGAAAAGLGSGLADLMAGYGLYVPGTAAIKFIVALLAGLLLNCKFIKSVPVRAIIAGVVGEVLHGARLPRVRGAYPRLRCGRSRRSSHELHPGRIRCRCRCGSLRSAAQNEVFQAGLTSCGTSAGLDHRPCRTDISASPTGFRHS